MHEDQIQISCGNTPCALRDLGVMVLSFGAVTTENLVVHTESFLRRNEQPNWSSYSLLRGKSNALTNTSVRTTYLRDIKIEREHCASEILSVNSDISGIRETVINPSPPSYVTDWGNSWITLHWLTQSLQCDVRLSCCPNTYSENIISEQIRIKIRVEDWVLPFHYNNWATI